MSLGLIAATLKDCGICPVRLIMWSPSSNWGKTSLRNDIGMGSWGHVAGVTEEIVLLNCCSIEETQCVLLVLQQSPKTLVSFHTILVLWFIVKLYFSVHFFFHVTDHFQCFQYFSLIRRIHISRATLNCLEGTYKTEDGLGRDRNEFLLKHNIDTFLICPQEEMNDADLNKPPKVHKTIRTENPEIPFGNVIDMNSVGTRSTSFNPNPYCTYVTIKMKFTFVALIDFILAFSCTADPRLLYKWFAA